jgi:tyrosine-protein kinase Etk/Wzc
MHNREPMTDDRRDEDEINLLDYLIVLARRKRLIITISLSAPLIALVFSLFMPDIYKAETRILPPGKSENSSIMLRELTNMVGITEGTGGFSDPSVITGIIESRTVYDRIVDRFNLMDTYETALKEEARHILSGNVNVTNDKLSHIITIAVMNRGPAVAADMANAFVDELKQVMQNLAITEASQRRLFFEGELKQAREALNKSEDAMREFQEKTGVLKVEDQARAVIESIANLRAQIAAKEVELKVMKTYSTSNNPDLQRMEEALKGLKTELKKLEAKGGSSPDPLMPTGRMPDVGTDYLRLLRDLKFNEEILELMAKQYEMARIDEARDPAIVQVIDKAIPPEKKYKPRRALIVAVAFVASFFLSLFAAFFMEYIEGLQSRDSESRDKMEIFKRYLSFKKRGS